MQIMEILIYVVLFAALIGTIIDSTAGAASNSNASAATQTIIKLIPLAVAIGAFYYAYKKAGITGKK